MTDPTVRIIGPGRDLLGESPVWNRAEGTLYWVDSRKKRVQRWTQAGVERAWDTPSEVGSIALAGHGRLLLALEQEFAWLDLDSGTVKSIAGITHSKLPTRMNDGRTDREGRFLSGSMVLHRQDPDGALHRLELDGRVTQLVAGVAVSNSLCFSPDGRTLYFADSLSGRIRAWDYARDGTLSNERVFADTHKDGSAPDGATVDAEGCVWVAFVLSARVARYAPDGRLLRSIAVPMAHPTCPCFGGPALDTLYVTSLRDTGNRLKSDHPDSGALAEITGLGVRGLPEVHYAGTLR